MLGPVGGVIFFFISMHLVFYQIIYRFFLVSRNLTIFFSIYLNVFLWGRQGGGGVITKLDYFWVDFYKF